MTQNPPEPSRAVFPLAELKAGDLLLMRGRSELSKLIAWFGDSQYSHVSLVSEDGLLIEAIRPMVAESPLSKRLAADGPVVLVDAYRSLSADGAPLADADRMAVLRHARSLLGTTFAKDELVSVGLLVALRGKPVHLPAAVRWVLYQATEHALRNDPRQMLCSEYAYRCFDEADVTPRRRLSRPIFPGPPSGLPFPEVDYEALIAEVKPLILPHVKGHLPAEYGVHAAESAENASGFHVGDEQLERSIQRLRGHLGLDEKHDENGLDPAFKAQDAVLMEFMAPPNPKLVRPRDLADSPASRFLGRLMEAPGLSDG